MMEAIYKLKYFVVCRLKKHRENGKSTRKIQEIWYYLERGNPDLLVLPTSKRSTSRRHTLYYLSHFWEDLFLDSLTGEMRYAETWDFDVTPATFLQFDIAMGCSGTYSTLYRYQVVFCN